jgi:hypothetical protein
MWIKGPDRRITANCRVNMTCVKAGRCPVCHDWLNYRKGRLINGGESDMTRPNLYQTAQELAQTIRRADAAKRVALQPELSRVLERLKADGQPVPLHLRQLDAVLSEEAFESFFDNMPV